MHINVQNNNNNILEDLKIYFYKQFKYIIIACVFGVIILKLFQVSKGKE